MLKLGKLGEVSFGVLKLGEASFEKLKLGKLGKASFEFWSWVQIKSLSPTLRSEW